jgi:hypothetical protein
MDSANAGVLEVSETALEVVEAISLSCESSTRETVRCRMVDPAGWVSLVSSTGATILSPMEALAPAAVPAVVGRFRCVKKSQARDGFEMTSEKAVVVEAGGEVDATEVRTNEAGVQRIQFADGWVSEHTLAGDICFELIESTLAAPEPTAKLGAAQQRGSSGSVAVRQVRAGGAQAKIAAIRLQTEAEAAGRQEADGDHARELARQAPAPSPPLPCCLPLHPCRGPRAKAAWHGQNELAQKLHRVSHKSGAELQGLSLRKLGRKAEEFGVPEAEIEAAQESDRPKDALRDLLLSVEPLRAWLDEVRA